MHRIIRTALVAASLLALGAAAHAAQAEERKSDTPTAATESAPASTPVFPSILPEGGHIAPQPPSVEEQQEAQRERSLAGVKASLANLKRMGLFAGESGIAMLLAGLGGIAIAIVVTLLRSRSRGFAPRR